MITKKFILTITFGSFLLAWGCTGNSAPTAEQQEMYENFVNPLNRNRPQPFWHINGELTTEGIYEQITDAYQKDGFGGVAVLPLTPAARTILQSLPMRSPDGFSSSNPQLTISFSCSSGRKDSKSSPVTESAKKASSIPVIDTHFMFLSLRCKISKSRLSDSRTEDGHTLPARFCKDFSCRHDRPHKEAG